MKHLAFSILTLVTILVGVTHAENLLAPDLTPVGAEKAGNKAGTIPEWKGGITKPPANYIPGSHHPDPYAEDKVLFSITGNNYTQYTNLLSPGQIALLKQYPTFKMNIYPTHRSASYPPRIYEASIQNAQTPASLVEGGNGVKDAINGVPFPIPHNGLEVIWNHLLRYRGDSVKRHDNQASVLENGNFSILSETDQVYFNYAQPGASSDNLDNVILYFKEQLTSPARLAGTWLLVHETLDQVKEPRHSWTYSPGLRRVSRAPSIAYDSPGISTDGLRTFDQFDMFNGATDRYDWTLVGKQELYVPYNSYALHSDKLTFSDILKKYHINSDYARYELHRVWKVEANLKKGASHIYGRRTFYFDEDSWQILLVDIYDNHGNLWRVSEGHVINYYDVPTLWTTLECHYDLLSKRYLVLGLDNQEKMIDFGVSYHPSEFTPASIRMAGTR